MKLAYYLHHLLLACLPAVYFQKRKHQLLVKKKHYDRAYITRRVNYYLKHNEPFALPNDCVSLSNFKKTGGSAYYYDMKEYLYFFDKHCQFAYHFGDETHIEPHPTLFKARPINGNNANSVLFKLNKRRHFKFIDDPYAFQDKKNMLVWRGAATQPHRKRFIEQYWNHPLCDAGQTNKIAENVPWQKDFLSIDEQLKYKFILCIEGNDVATNVKWVMSSNSVCMMPKPKFETWFMEGTLEAGKHYIELKDDYSDLEEKVRYYSEYPEEAEAIIANAHQYIAQFQDETLEEIICLAVLEKYFRLSGQQQTD